MRHVFFSFHYQLDIFRANVVRNAWVSKGGSQPAGYKDRSMWESAQTRNDRRLARMIDAALHGTSVTVVLIGAETASRPWVDHEIIESWNRGNGLLGVYIHNIRDMRDQSTSWPGENPFQGIEVEDDDGEVVDLAELITLYDWVLDDGYSNFADWVEQAAQEAGR